MKKTVAIISSLCILLACLVTDVSALSVSTNNFNNPRGITLPANKGCGDNVIGLYVEYYISPNYVSQKSKYKWDLLTGNADVLHACDAVKIEASHRMLVEVDNAGASYYTKSGVFFGSDMTTTQYHSLTNNTHNFYDEVTYVKYTHTTTVKNPFDQSVIASDLFEMSYQ